MSNDPTPGTILRCSFCKKEERYAAKLVPGPDGVAICDECVEICRHKVLSGEPQDCEGMSTVLETPPMDRLAEELLDGWESTIDVLILTVGDLQWIRHNQEQGDPPMTIGELIKELNLCIEGRAKAGTILMERHYEMRAKARAVYRAANDQEGQ